jgi:rRNA small subunit pseudouridine methyltransferase Nep1
LKSTSANETIKYSATPFFSVFTIVFAETALERVPPELCNEPLVVSAARKRGKKPEEMLLDWSLHSEVMKRLDDWQRRGRPDQCYKFLSLCQESLANQNGELRVFVHTRNDEVLSIHPQTRLPPSYNAFEGLLEDLYRKRVIEGGGKTLLSLKDCRLSDLLNGLNGKFAVLDKAGERFPGCKGLDGAIIGGFPEGNLENPLEGLPRYSLGDHDLTPSATACQLLGGL